MLEAFLVPCYGQRIGTAHRSMPMLSPTRSQPDSVAYERPPRSSVVSKLARRAPFISLFGICLLSNAAGSIFNFAYNEGLIIRNLDAAQTRAFWFVVSPIYNIIAYPIGLGATILLFLPLARCLRRLRAGESCPPEILTACRRRLINLPFYGVLINSLCWIPGAVFFPALVCWLGGDHMADFIWSQFVVSFTVSALLTTVQTFFLMETFLTRVLYPDFFRDARPADIDNVIRIPFRLRLLLLWAAVAIMPLVAIVAVAVNFPDRDERFLEFNQLIFGVATVGIASGGLVCWLVGGDLLRWLQTHASATKKVATEDFEVRIAEKRPDEWGRLNDRFNDMVAALGRGRQVHETLGQFVGPDVRDEIITRYPGLGGEVQEITILFADIRGFTRRSAGERPERVVRLLNRFLTLGVRAVEDKGGWVNKFLGDGIMALFGAPRPRDDHADLAVSSAVDLLERLEELNRELVAQREAPLKVGIGIHTGPALVGCVGATLETTDGRERMRREFTAIGETVNHCQRVEQLTKSQGGPILLSEQTRRKLREIYPLVDLGPQPLAGSKEILRVFSLDLNRNTTQGGGQ